MLTFPFLLSLTSCKTVNYVSIYLLKYFGELPSETQMIMLFLSFELGMKYF